MSKTIDIIKKSIKQKTLLHDATSILIMKLGYSDINLAGQNSRYKAFTTLKRKYGKYIGKNDFPHYENDERMKVWVCWLQGIDNAPKLVKDCFASMKHYITEYEIVEITKDNFSEYITLPDYIIDKWKKGIIPNAQFADILRLQLLIEHGGLWIDSTAYLTDSLPEYITDGDFFVYRDGFFESEVINMGNWLIYSKTNNILLLETQSLLFRYWKDHNYIFNYFIFHLFFRMVSDYYREEWNKLPYFNQMNSHIFQIENLYDTFDEKRWRQLKELTSIHKLTHKIDESKLQKNSFYSMTDKLYLI